MKSTIAIAAGVLVLLTACSPWSQFPETEVSSVADTELDCAGLDDEILKANALRDAVADERRKRRSRGAAGTGLAVLTNPAAPLTGLISVGRLAMAESRYNKASVSAEDRLHHLLALKRANHCPQTPTADPALSEHEILERLDTLAAAADTDGTTAGNDGLSRQSLFDSLR